MEKKNFAFQFLRNSNPKLNLYCDVLLIKKNFKQNVES